MRILFNTVITFLSITYAFESYAAAAELPENGHLARISIVRDSGLYDEEIIKVVKNGGNLTIHRSRTSGVVEKDDDPTEYSRHLSLFKVYSRLLTEYYIGRDSEKRIDQLLLLARVVVDKGLEDIGTFFPDRNSLYDYISRELHKQRMSTDVKTYKTQLAIREAHICLSKAEEATDPETRNELFRKAYSLFEIPYNITKNKYGFPWLAKIIVDHGYLANQETREEALALAERFLDTYAIPRDRGESLSSVEPETEGGRAAKEQHRVRVHDTMQTSSDLAMTMRELLHRQRQESVDGAPAGLDERGGVFSAATTSTFAAASVGSSSSSSSSAAAFAAAATAPVGFLTIIAAANMGESPFATAALSESLQHFPVAAGSVASEKNGDRFSVDTAFGSVDTASIVFHEFSSSSSSSSAAASTAAGETAAVVERQKRPRSPESTIEADNFNNRKRAAAADESDDDESLYRGNRRFPVDPSPVALAAAADESDDDDDESLYRGNRRFPVDPSPVALAAAADESDKKPLSLDEVKAEFMDWAAKSKGYRPENRKNRASVAAGPSEFDEGTRTEFARTVQRVIRWKILHPAKTNNEIATDLDLSRAVVIQALS